jgi:hypothetical protein
MKTMHRQTRNSWHNQENEIADAMRAIYGEANVQPGSGNQPGKPNDVRVPGYAYIECKNTASQQMTVKHSWLAHLRRLSLPLRGYLAIKFSVESSTNYYIVEDTVFEHLLKCEQELLNPKLIQGDT